MKQLILTATLAATLFGNAALAGASKENGFYLGGALGATELEDDGFYTDFGYRIDDEDSSVQFNAGYKFLPSFAVEARVIDLGEYRITDCCSSAELSLDAVSIHAVGIAPFGESGWELFGQLGIGRIDFDCTSCSDETAGSVGIGIRFSPTENIGISFQVDAYAYEETDFTGDYDVGIVTSQAGFQYLF